MRRSPYCTPPDEDAYAPTAAAAYQLPPPHPHMGAQQPAMLHMNNNHHSESHLPPHLLARDRRAVPKQGCPIYPAARLQPHELA
jgi:hypothetical protein